MRCNRTVLFALLLALLVGTVGLMPATAQATGWKSDVLFAPIGTYSTGLGEASGETVAIQGHRAFITNSDDNSLDIVDFSTPSAPTLVRRVDLSQYGAGPNSVDVRLLVVAVAVEADPKTDPGKVVFFDLDGNYLNEVTVGPLPDMLTFTPDGRYLLVANEGEPNDDYSVDPEGSVSVIRMPFFVKRLTDDHVATAEFTDHLEIPEGVRIFGPNASPAQDLEPEYITVDHQSKKAYVTLQENNAIAVLDIKHARFTKILPLGAKDHSLPGNGIDASDRDDTINIANWPIFGFYMPDAVASYSVGRKTYLVTANEGDARDYDGFAEEERVKDLTLDPNAFPNAEELQEDENLGRLTVTTVNGDGDGDGLYEELYAFGGRSFTIWDEHGNVVWDSGNQLEQITADALPAFFNSQGPGSDFDSRSDNKGPEPEGVAVGKVAGRTLAFVGLERIGGVMIFDVSNPKAPEFVQYINNADFVAETGDIAPEIITFVPAYKSPTLKARFVVANEVSGTVTIYEQTDPDGAGSLTLLHNSDGESSLLPGTADSLSVGSAAAFKSVMDREIGAARSAGRSVMTVYAGDAILASATLACSLPPNPDTTPVYDAVAQRQMRYDAHILGNHEFDFSPDFLERFIRGFEVNGRLTQPFLSANLDFSGEPGFDDLVDADGLILGTSTDGRVVARSKLRIDPITGQRFGIVGATTPGLQTISSPRNVTVTPDNASTAAVVQQEIDRLRKLGVNKIIFVSHLQSVSNDRELIALINGIDIAVAGGGDDLLNSPAIDDSIEFLPGETPRDPADPNNQYPARLTDADGRTVYLVTTGGNYRYLGRFDATFDSAGEITSFNADTSFARRVIIQNADSDAAGITDAVTPDAAIVETVNEPVSACLADLASPIARTEVVLNVARGAFSGGVTTTRGVRSFETNSGNLVTDGFLDAYDRYAAAFGLPARGPGNLVVAVQNGGGMRQTGTTAGNVLPEGGVAPGNITRQNTLDLLAFLTNVTTVVSDVTPEQLKLILERSAASPGGGQFLQIAGFTVTYDLSFPAHEVSAPPPGEFAGTITTPGERVREVTYTGGNTDPSDDVVFVTGGVVQVGAPNVRIVTNSFTAGGGDNYAAFEDIPASQKVVLPATYEQALVEYLLTFPLDGGLPTIPASDARYAENVNQRIFGVPVAP